MGIEALLILLIGLVGIFIGMIAMILIARRQVTPKTSHSKVSEDAESETISVLGKPVDIRELRILRSLFGEQKGRRLGSFKDKYYRPALDATIDKGWVKQVGSRFAMTPEGDEFCRAYLKQLLSEWKTADQT